MLDVLDEHAPRQENRHRSRSSTTPCAMRAEGIDTADGRTDASSTSSTRSSSRTPSRSMAERLGIVYTPVEVVDFILRSVRRRPADTSSAPASADEGVHILDPFTGTGTFIVRLLQSGLIDPRTWRASTGTSCTPTRSCCWPTTSPRSTSRPPTTAAERRGVRAVRRDRAHRHLPDGRGRRHLTTSSCSRSTTSASKRKGACPSASSSATRPTPSGRQPRTTTTQNLEYPTLDAQIAETTSKAPKASSSRNTVRLLHPRHPVGHRPHRRPRRHRLRHQRRLDRLQRHGRHPQGAGRRVQRHLRVQPARQPAHRR